ncbi:Retrovirus-related Gag polyprotein from transposon HMS-Beagle [Eumeta japonica]|uniref:Retrovirus-related Gag polyprotein from transposon HMS-Beagle n=1 Tax=Eumeta variegata TaxID=151549 RepID=A0A4C1SDE8_EUMVA|nr:Retrovirus-related Gag polyprotein from transposon HMS-Beagle [Eumeta japonica]
MEASNESIKLLTQTYREKALDTFVRGLRGDLPRLLGVREPKDLPHALYLCQKLDNQTDRNSLSGRNQRPPVVLPPRRNIMQQITYHKKTLKAINVKKIPGQKKTTNTLKNNLNIKPTWRQ